MPKVTQPRKTWEYTTGFKVKAVKLSYQQGIQVKQVATTITLSDGKAVENDDKELVMFVKNPS